MRAKRMQEVGMAGVFKALCQDVVSTPALRDLSYADCMEIVRRVPVYRAIMGLKDSMPARGGVGKAGPRAVAGAERRGRGLRRGEHGSGGLTTCVTEGRPNSTGCSSPEAGNERFGSPRGRDGLCDCRAPRKLGADTEVNSDGL